MNDTLEKFRKNAEAHGICEMAKDWDNCKSNKQLIDLALSARGIEYVAKAIAEGWGVPADEICKAFAPFNNGKYIRDKDGYTSAMYCIAGDNCELNQIVATTSALLVIGFQGAIYIPKNRICELHLVNCQCYIKGEGRSKIHTYGSTEICKADESLNK